MGFFGNTMTTSTKFGASAGIGAVYGATVGRGDGQSWYGGAMTGALGGASLYGAGRYGAAGVRAAAPRWNSVAGEIAAGAGYGRALGKLGRYAGNGAWEAMRQDAAGSSRFISNTMTQTKGFIKGLQGK